MIADDRTVAVSLTGCHRREAELAIALYANRPVVTLNASEPNATDDASHFVLSQSSSC